MAFLRTSDFDVFQAALRGMHGGALLRSRPERHWRVRSEALPNISLTLASEAASTIFTGRSDPGVFHCIVPFASSGVVLVNGVKLVRGQVVWLAPGEQFHLARMRPSRWVDICIDTCIVDGWMGELIQPSRSESSAKSCVLPDRDHLAILLLVVRESLRMNRFLDDSEESIAMRSTLSLTLADCLFGIFAQRFAGDAVCRVSGRHTGILEATLGLIDASDTSMPDTDGMCAVAHTTERTIRNVFNEFFGISPHRYLMLRRLHSIRRAIRESHPDESITSICARHNVWDFGRFSGQYRACFGVLPSIDLIESKKQRHGNVIHFQRRAKVAEVLPSEPKAANRP